MNVEHIRTAREANPFRPFTIHLADGRSHRVPHRDYLSMSPGGRTLIVYESDEAGHMLDALLITELAIDKPVAAASTASDGS